MTTTELKALTNQKFDFMALDKDGNIKFATPVPGVAAWKFASEEDAQAFIWDSEEIEACEAAWEKYVRALSVRKRRKQKTVVIKVSMDYATKDRLAICAEEQHKKPSQMIVDWIWDHPIKAEAKRAR